MNRTASFLIVAVSMLSGAAYAQRSSSSLYLTGQKCADVTIPFDIQAEGKRFSPTWGLDQAWINEQNILKGLNHMGKENIGIARSAFSYTKELTNDSVIANADLSKLRTRNGYINQVDKNLPIVLTADQGAFDSEKGEVPPEYFVKKKVVNVDHWAAMINSHVHWLQQNTTHPVLGVSAFNEPDYWAVEEGATKESHAEVARILKERYPRMADVAMVGGNTLNDDKAWDWFNEGLDIYDWGNTHQLAGSFDNYANFYQQLAAKGKVGYNDEMHNVGEAMVGLEYGMTVGIWWGFDSRARGEFCDISRNGQRIAYGEHRNNWTAASVYRHDDGRVKAFVGSSERQAYTTTYNLISKDRLVYYNGFGPQYECAVDIQGGSAYQVGQTNAEQVIDITWGEDVAPCPIVEGIYQIVNKTTGNAVAINDGTIVQQKFTGAKMQEWTLRPCTSTTTFGDISFYDIESANNANTRINVKNYSTKSGAELLAYNQSKATSNEQWYLQYAGDGYYYIRNRESALYMTSAGTSTSNNVKVNQSSLFDESKRDRQLWRILPVDITYDTDAPATPVQLTTRQLPAAVMLSWAANSESDLEGYMVLRAEKGSDEWNTIARKVKDHYFVDNTCRTGLTYIYKVKAIDQAQNMSQCSETVECSSTGERTMIARWHMDGSLFDVTDNMMDGVAYGTLTYVDDCKSGAKALRFSNSTTGATNYVRLPYNIADSEELTVALWVNLRGSKTWQRIFDFGNDTDHYLFLTTSNGSKMRFAIKNGGSEQTVDAPLLTNMVWAHVAVTIGNGKTTIYINGEVEGSSTSITIRPSDIRPIMNYLGRSQFAADPCFTGYMDDVRIYNYALTEEEVQAVMADTTNGIREMEEGRGKKEDVVYDLQGRRLSKPVRGLQIIRSAEGPLQGKNTKKVVIK